MNRAINFNPGPAALPLAVLQEAAKAVLDLDACGMCVLEISHRAKAFDAIHDEACERILRLLSLSADDYAVLFLGGGASLQFYMTPLNYLSPDTCAAYVDTGTWSRKAIEQSRRVGATHVIASSEEAGYSRLPEIGVVPESAAYVHITTNNTIEGTEWHDLPATGPAPLVADMSSDFLALDRDHSRFVMMYAGAQKNIGPAGVTVVVARKSFIEAARADVPEMLSYRLHARERSVYNTPPVFAVYVVALVCRWIEANGGVVGMGERNRTKADLVYRALDAHPDVYEPTVTETAHRSLVNVTFRLTDPSREAEFLEGAKQRNMVGLKGHRSVGGFRASMYNAFEVEWASQFAEYLEWFAGR